MSLPLVILILVFWGIGLKQVCRIPLKIWHIIGLGALIVLVSGKISPHGAWEAIDGDVIFFLFRTFVLG